MDESSSPETSRPPSRAQSDATEVPEFPQGPRTLGSDIEHIKILISRSTTSSIPPEGSITAQVFRSRSGSTGSNGQVSQQRLFHELDLLKKRIKHEQHHVRRPSQIDPETESESEDVLDEREEELENIRGQLVAERRQREDLLSAAEVRIDNLSEEKEDMSELLKSNRAELAKFKQLKADVDSALGESTEKIKELEEKNRGAGEDVQRLIAEHKSREYESERLYRDLQERHDKIEKEAHASQAKIKDLERAVNEHETVKNHVEALMKERDEHKAHYESQRSQLQKELEEARSEHGVQLESLRSEHEKHIQTINDASAEAKNLERRSASDLEDLTTRLTIEQQENESLREQLKTKEDLHQEQVKSAEARIGHMEEAIAEFEQRAANAEALLRNKEEELGSEVAAKENEITEIQRELAELHKKLYDQSIELQGKNAELSKAIEAAEEDTTALKADLAKARQACDGANRSWADDIAGFKAEQERLVKELQEGWSSKAEQAARAHHAELSSAQENFRKEFAELSTSSERRIAGINEDRANEIAKLKEEVQSEIAALKKSHKKELSRVHAAAEKELATALSNADDDLDERLRAQSKAHRKELDKLHESLNTELTQLHVQLEEASQLRQTQMKDAETQHLDALKDLGEKLEAAEQASIALQSRLDAESTGRAEAERSLAGFRKQRFEEDRTQSETNEALQRQIDALEAERDTLTRRFEANPISSTSDLQDQEREFSISLDSSEDVSILKEKLAAAEQERDEAHASIEQKLDEAARQNLFLVKELETVMAQRNTEQAPLNAQNNAWIQTEPVTIIDETVDPRALHESKADMATSIAAKIQRQNSQKHVNDVPDIDEKRKSFEDYLKQAQAELSYLGIDLSANEEFFSGKIQEHMAELHAAKEDLSSEYQRKFGALYAEKERMERAVSAKNAAEFTKARGELLSRYGIHEDDPGKQAAMLASLPMRKKKAVWSTEATLVSEYNRRVTKRKSQIAVKHAEKFHLLTQDHNRRIAGLVSDREKPEGDESISADGAEHHPGGIEVNTAALEGDQVRAPQHNPQPARSPLNGAERTELEDALKAAANTTPRSRLPKRISISKPRTPTSIPRAVPYRGDWARGDGTSRSQKANPATDVPAASPDIGPGAGTPSTQLPSASKSSDALTSDIVDAFRRLSIEPNDSEGDAQHKSVQTRSVEAAKPQRSRPRAMRHSSRAIFGFQETSES